MLDQSILWSIRIYLDLQQTKKKTDICNGCLFLNDQILSNDFILSSQELAPHLLRNHVFMSRNCILKSSSILVKKLVFHSNVVRSLQTSLFPQLLHTIDTFPSNRFGLRMICDSGVKQNKNIIVVIRNVVSGMC